MSQIKKIIYAYLFKHWSPFFGQVKWSYRNAPRSWESPIFPSTESGFCTELFYRSFPEIGGFPKIECN